MMAAAGPRPAQHEAVRSVCSTLMPEKARTLYTGASAGGDGGNAVLLSKKVVEEEKRKV